MTLTASKSDKTEDYLYLEGLSNGGFEGLEGDGVYYFNARWYDPETGRFVTEDPIKDGLLWYAYVNNNPMGFVDPTGLDAEARAQRAEERGDTERAQQIRDNAARRERRKEARKEQQEVLNQLSKLSLEELEMLQNAVETTQDTLQTVLESYGDLELFLNDFDMESFIYENLGYLCDDLGIRAPDGFIITSYSATAIAGEGPFGIGLEGGLELVHTKDYGWTVFGHMGAGGGSTGGTGAIEVGIIWGLNGDSKNYRGPFLDLQGNLGPIGAGISGFWWFTDNPITCIKAGYCAWAPTLSNAGVAGLAEVYTRLWDQQDGFYADEEDILDAITFWK